MKFGKLIQALIDEALPAWKDKFLRYKYLKKWLNSLLAEYVLINEKVLAVEGGSLEHTRQEDVLYAGMSASNGGFAAEGVVGDHVTTVESSSRKRGGAFRERNAKQKRLHFDDEFKRLLEVEFTRLLQEELNKLNDFVEDMEEHFVIRLQEFKEKTEGLKGIIEAKDKNHSDVINLHKDVVVFHGEMILLKSYMSLNYTGLVKIVKKHDRLTGAWLRLSFIPDVLRQPFYSTEILSRLVTECESNLLSLFPSFSGETADRSLEQKLQDSAVLDANVFDEEGLRTIYKSTMTALKVIRNMARGSSTYSVYSMPPCEDNEDAGSVVEEER